MILHGVDKKIKGADVSMFAFGATHPDTEVDEFANYVIFHFGSLAGSVTPEMIARQRQL